MACMGPGVETRSRNRTYEVSASWSSHWGQGTDGSGGNRKRQQSCSRSDGDSWYREIERGMRGNGDMRTAVTYGVAGVILEADLSRCLILHGEQGPEEEEAGKGNLPSQVLVRETG